jgi:hypothetical protein
LDVRSEGPGTCSLQPWGADAAAIITFNLADFPSPASNRSKSRSSTLTPFLLDLLDLAPGPVVDELGRRVAAQERSR